MRALAGDVIVLLTIQLQVGSYWLETFNKALNQQEHSFPEFEEEKNKCCTFWKLCHTATCMTSASDKTDEIQTNLT